MSTPVSTATPYCTIAEFLDRYSVGLVSDLLSDTKTRPTPDELNTLGTPVNSRLTNLLMEASGWVEAACYRGTHYTPADLNGLTGASAGMLQGMVAGITMFLLWERRPQNMGNQALPVKCDMAMNMLQQLEMGTRVFGIQEVAQAALTPTPQFMSLQDLQLRNFTSNQMYRFFGDRSQYQVPGPNTGTLPGQN